jgi:hypothetical protein
MTVDKTVAISPTILMHLMIDMLHIDINPETTESLKILNFEFQSL